MTHLHEYRRHRAGATVETCPCGAFRFTDNAGPAIPGVTRADVDAMRDWLKDLSFADIEPEDMDALDTATILRAVDRNYAGGISAFLRAGEVA